MARAFISYSGDDRGKAAALAAAIEDYGHEVWWDKDLIGGDDFQRVIEDKLSQVDAVIVLWTESSIRKPWVLAEAAMGVERDCLIAVRYDPNLDPPKAFAHIQAEFLGDWDGRKRAPQIGKLVERINELKHAHDRQRLVGAVPPVLRAAAEETNLLSTIFGAALPGGLPIYEFVLGTAFTALALWALLAVVRQLPDGGGSEDAGGMPGLEWLYLVVAGIAMARAIDQYICVSRKESSIRFFDRSFTRASATSVLLAIIVLTGLYLAIGMAGYNLDAPTMSN